MAFRQISNMPPQMYPCVLYSSNICEILLYSQQLVVLTYELIYVDWAAHR